MRRAVLADPSARALYRRVLWVQAAATVAGGVALTGALAILGYFLLQDADTQLRLGPGGLTLHTGGDGPRDGRAVTTDSPVRLAEGLLYVLFASLTIAESVVIALSREYHDQIGRSAALLTGTPPEDPEAAPRVRLDLRWVWRKLKRKVRGLRVFVVGLPVLGVVALAPWVGSYVYAVLVAAWSAYWGVVFAGAKSALAWTDEATAPEPFFLRAVRRVPVLKWYVPVWRRFTRDVFAPCRRVEEHPVELAALAAARLVGLLPVLYLFFRPFLPVAAARILASDRAEAEAPTSAPGSAETSARA